MNKDELKEKIKEAIVLNEKFETICISSSHESGTIKPNEDLRKWLGAVSKDLDDGLIPPKIIDIISHHIDDLQLPALSSRFYDFSNEGEKEKYVTEYAGQVLLCRKYLDTYLLFKSVGYAEKNTVIIGANGSGKTSLANNLKETLNVRDGIVIPAQKLLLVPSFDTIPSYRAECESFPSYQKAILDDKRKFVSKSNDDMPYEMAREYTTEYRRVLALLVAERNYKRNEFIDNLPDGKQLNKSDIKTTFDIVVDIWNDLISLRTIALTPESIPYLKYEKNGEEKEYEAYRMSDGERIILYLVARVMQAPQNGLIIVDEPEVFLHRTVVDKLWTRLEKERKDCVFVYLTHDLQFAASRVGVKSWIKEYIYPSKWVIKLIDDSDIPEQLLMELLGSCKQILFCEGTSTSSLDKKVFDVLFPDFVIRPLESCKEVISYTKAYNAIPNINTRAIGIVDSDFRSKEEVGDLETNHIYSYHVAEIENVFMVEGFINAFKEYHRLEGNVENIKAGVIDMFEKNKVAQCSNYVTARIDYHYRKYHVHKGNTKDEVQEYLKSFNDDIQIEKWYKERMREIDLYIREKNYAKIIRIYNNKGLHSIVEKEFGITDYHTKALSFLKVAPDSVLDELRKLFPVDLKLK